eukprot:scaffold4950_cov99-Isochrysis_galbana.AAC.8
MDGRARPGPVLAPFAEVNTHSLSGEVRGGATGRCTPLVGGGSAASAARGLALRLALRLGTLLAAARAAHRFPEPRVA